MPRISNVLRFLRSFLEGAIQGIIALALSMVIVLVLVPTDFIVHHNTIVSLLTLVIALTMIILVSFSEFCKKIFFIASILLGFFVCFAGGYIARDFEDDSPITIYRCPDHSPMALPKSHQHHPSIPFKAHPEPHTLNEFKRWEVARGIADANGNLVFAPGEKTP